MATVQFIKRIGHSDISTLAEDRSAFFYEAGIHIDADGGPHAYHPDGKSGLDYLANAGKPGNWWALATDNGKASGNPVIQGAGDPAPGFYVSTTALMDPNADPRTPRAYVNAETINFIVLPGGIGLKTKLGDFCVVIRLDTVTYDYAIYADVGPAGQIGEASISMARSLAIPSNPRAGGAGHGILYIVFPGTSQGWPLTQAGIDQSGAAAFAKWGALDMAKACFPDAPWGNSPPIQIATPAVNI